MKFTGQQLAKAAEIADGADVIVRMSARGDGAVFLHRLEDHLRVNISRDGTDTIITEATKEVVND